MDCENRFATVDAMKKSTTIVSIVLSVGCLIGGASAVSADPDTTTEARAAGRALFRKAAHAYHMKDFATAADLYQQSYDASPISPTLYTLANSYEELGRQTDDVPTLQRAVETYNHYIAVISPGIHASGIKHRIEKLHELIASLTK